MKESIILNTTPKKKGTIIMEALLRKVYANLKEGTEELHATMEEYNKLVEKEKSGKYSQEYLEKEVRPKLVTAKMDIEKAKEAALSNARAIVRAYQEELRA